MNHDTDPHAEAIDWHIRLRFGGDADWEAFQAWLARDPAHADAYRAIEELDLALEPMLPHLVVAKSAERSGMRAPPAADARLRFRRNWAIAGGAIAASITATIIAMPPSRSNHAEIAKTTGEKQAAPFGQGRHVAFGKPSHLPADFRDAPCAGFTARTALPDTAHYAGEPASLRQAVSARTCGDAVQHGR